MTIDPPLYGILLLIWSLLTSFMIWVDIVDIIRFDCDLGYLRLGRDLSADSGGESEVGV